jgi:DNA replication ATP-dependent helicase Dna2
MVVQSAAPATGPQTARIHKFTYRFARWIDPARTRPSTMFIANQSLLSGHISPGDPIAVSLEPGLVSLARGFVLDLRAEWVSVGLDTELDERVLVERLSRKSKVKDGQPLQFRIDKDELATGMGRIRDNLTQLFLPSASEILRSLIVDLSPPHFDNALAPRQEDLPAHLNPDQQKAVTTVLTAKDYALILGMPGTGKTSTVVEVVRALVRQGKSVLLTSYTHSAVDTIVVKLAEAGGVDILRLGNPDKVILRLLSDLRSMRRADIICVLHLSSTRSIRPFKSSLSAPWLRRPAWRSTKHV